MLHFIPQLIFFTSTFFHKYFIPSKTIFLYTNGFLRWIYYTSTSSYFFLRNKNFSMMTAVDVYWFAYRNMYNRITKTLILMYEQPQTAFSLVTFFFITMIQCVRMYTVYNVTLRRFQCIKELLRLYDIELRKFATFVFIT